MPKDLLPKEETSKNRHQSLSKCTLWSIGDMYKVALSQKDNTFQSWECIEQAVLSTQHSEYLPEEQDGWTQ